MIWIKRAIALLCIIAISRLCHHKTDGFRISKITDNTIENGSLQLPIFSSDQEKRAQEVLTQPFTYLARGKQSFVFLSEDQKTVLKLLNNHYQWQIRAYALLPNIPWKEKNLSYFEKKLKMAGESYLLTFSQLREETGAFFLHLQKTDHLKQKVKIVDKLGISHEIDLDQTGFILQARATLAYPQFEQWIKQKDLSSAQKGITSLIFLIKNRIEKEIADRDPLIRTNIGFIKGKAHFLDLGPFSKNLIHKSPLEKRQELEKITHSFRGWLREKEPELALFLDEEIRKAL